jgi:hypothetical protein
MSTPSDALHAFFSSIPADERALLLTICARQIDADVSSFEEASDADQWLQKFLDPSTETIAIRHFAKTLWMIAILDFELSPFALGRLITMHQHIIEQESQSSDPDSRLAEMSRQMLRDRVPLLKNFGENWRDIRMHELDEASLWVYRDEMRQQDMEGLGKRIDRLRS